MKTPSVQREGEFLFVPIRRHGSGSAAVLCWRIDILVPAAAVTVADLEWHATPPRRWILLPCLNPLLGEMAERAPLRLERSAGFRPRSVPARVRREAVRWIAAWSARACIAAAAEEIYGDAEEAVTA